MSSNLDWEHISQTDIINTKKHLEIDQEKLKSSFDRLERSLDEELAKLSSKVIPEISFHQLAKNNGIFGDDIEAAVKKHGVLIIRNVFDPDYAIRLYNDLSQYLMQNGENPSQHGSTWYSVYWSKEQVLSRSLKVVDTTLERHSNPKFNFGFKSSTLNISWGNIHRSQCFNQILT